MLITLMIILIQGCDIDDVVFPSSNRGDERMYNRPNLVNSYAPFKYYRNLPDENIIPWCLTDSCTTFVDNDFIQCIKKENNRVCIIQDTNSWKLNGYGSLRSKDTLYESIYFDDRKFFNKKTVGDSTVYKEIFPLIGCPGFVRPLDTVPIYIQLPVLDQLESIPYIGINIIKHIENSTRSNFINPDKILAFNTPLDNDGYLLFNVIPKDTGTYQVNAFLLGKDTKTNSLFEIPKAEIVTFIESSYNLESEFEEQQIDTSVLTFYLFEE